LKKYGDEHLSPPSGYDKKRAFAHVEKIGETITEIYQRSDAEGLPTSIIADRLAEERIEKARRT
jgi:leucine dehydrogenase